MLTIESITKLFHEEAAACRVASAAPPRDVWDNMTQIDDVDRVTGFTITPSSEADYAAVLLFCPDVVHEFLHAGDDPDMPDLLMQEVLWMIARWAHAIHDAALKVELLTNEDRRLHVELAHFADNAEAALAIAEIRQARLGLSPVNPITG